MIATCAPEELRIWRRNGASETLAQRLGCGPLLASLLCMRGKGEKIEDRDLGVLPLEETLEKACAETGHAQFRFIDNSARKRAW